MKDFPRILIMSREEAEAFVAGPADVCISIRSPGAPRAALSENYREVLPLWFDDIASMDRERAIAAGATALSETDADTIAKFALRHRDAERLVVHCEAGISRSVAVALAVGSRFTNYWPFPKWYRKEWRAERFVHNREVFDLVRAAVDRVLARPAPTTVP